LIVILEVVQTTTKINSFELFNQRKKYHGFHKKYEAAQLFSTMLIIRNVS